MKILWVADFGIHHNIGGAQRTNQLFIDYGIKKHKLEIETFHYDSDLGLLNQDWDLIISNNLESIHRNSQAFDFLLNHPQHIRLEHDSNSYMPEQKRIDLFGSTILNIFLSEFHLNKFKELYGDIFNKTAIVYPFIDPSFYDEGLAREDKTLYVGFMHPFKGTLNFFEHVLNNPDKEFVMASWGDKKMENTARRFDNVEWLGKVDFIDMPKLYNKYETLYYHPDKFEPFCRTIGEALSCNIKVDTSNNIGAKIEYDKDSDKFFDRCASSNDLFWSVILEHSLGVQVAPE